MEREYELKVNQLPSMDSRDNKAPSMKEEPELLRSNTRRT